MKFKMLLCSIVLSVLCLTGCNSNNGESNSHGDNPSDVINESSVGVTIDGFTNFDDTIAGKIPNAQETFTFGSNVKSSKGCTWKIYKNLTGSEEIVTKTVDCDTGDNVVYLFAQSASESKLYTVIIRRRPLYTVSYDFYKSIAVEEDSLIDQNQLEHPSKQGYEFNGWDYDFSKPVVGDLEIHAVWEIKEYTISNVL